MSRTTRPSVTLRCVANQYAPANERIVEVSSHTGKGCLISLRDMPDGTLRIEVYRADDGVTVTAPTGSIR
jgi:hypothetical protein